MVSQFRNFILSVLFMIAGVKAVHGQENISPDVRPVKSAWTIGIGSSHLADTYLTPLKYGGWSTSIDYERMQDTRWWPGKWEMRLRLGLSLDHTENPARNATMWGARLRGSWGMMRRWTIPCGIHLAVGPALTVEGGCLYNDRNSNNPASAKGAVTADVIGYVAYDVKLWRLPVTLRWQPETAVLGAFFSPKYDELYYEIYLGNHSGLVHPAWWGNRFRFDNLVTADLHLGSTSIRVGYECGWMSSHVSNLTTRMITHRFVIGVTTEWIGFKRNR